MPASGDNSTFRRRGAICPVALIVVVCSVTGPLRGDEYARQLEKIRTAWTSAAKSDQWTNGRFVSVIRRAEPGGEMMVANERSMTHRSSSQGKLIDNQSTEFESGTPTQQERIVLLVNPEYSCRITDKSGAGQFILNGLPVIHKGNDGRAQIDGSHHNYRLRWLAPAETFQLASLIDPNLTQVSNVEETETQFKVVFRAIWITRRRTEEIARGECWYTHGEPSVVLSARSSRVRVRPANSATFGVSIRIP